MTKNNPYSKWLLHSVDCELFSNNLYEETLESLQELFKQIEVEWIRTPFVSSKKIFTDMMNKILELIAEYEDELDLEYEDYFNDVVSLESGWLKDFAKKELKKDYETPRSLASSVLFASAAGLGTYKEINNAQAQRISRDVSASLRTAYLTKEPTQKVIERLKKKEEVEKKNLKTETNTVSNTAFNLVDYLTFKKNKEVLVLSAILDSSTCDECASLHGTRYSAAEAPITPFHTRCRCELVPEAIFTEDNKFNDFDDWIDSLDNTEQRRVLGVNRYFLYKQGFKPHRFYNEGKRISKEELYSYMNQNKEVVNNIPKEKYHIPLPKITEYALKDKDKSALFKDTFGYTLDNYQDLIDNIYNNLQYGKMLPTENDGYGEKFRQHLIIKGPNGNYGNLRVAWILQEGEYKLMTTFPDKKLK